MNFWQIKVSIKDWAKEAEFQNLKENDIYSQKIQDKKNEPRDNINDIVFVHNTVKGTNKKYPDGLYFICKIVTKIKADGDKQCIDLEVIKSLKDEPKDLAKYGFKKLKESIDRQGANGRIYIFKDEDRGSQLYSLIMGGNLSDALFPEELSEKEASQLKEGAKKEITVNSYERNSKARQKCIDKFGYNCTVCNINFETVYGDIGKEFIHVHHLVPLSEIKKEYEINASKDLRPVCPNCHAMLHRKSGVPYSIEELKNILKMRV